MYKLFRSSHVHLFMLLLTMMILPLELLQAQTIRNHSLESRVLNKSWSYSIYLPKAVNEPGRTFPVVFLLHGMFNSNKTFAGKGFEQHINNLIEKQLIDPVIIVFPNGFRHSWWINSQEFGAIQDAFFEDLIPYIEAHYPVSVQQEQRVMAGISMGGFGAINYAFDDRGNFGHLLLFSPALFLPSPQSPEVHPNAAATNWQHRNVLNNTLSQRAFALDNDPESFNALKFLPHTYPYLHQRQSTRLQELNILLYYGDSDPVTDSGTRFFHDFLTQHSLPAFVQVSQGEKHSWLLWRQDLGLALQRIFPAKSS